MGHEASKESKEKSYKEIRNSQLVFILLRGERKVSSVKN